MIPFMGVKDDKDNKNKKPDKDKILKIRQNYQKTKKLIEEKNKQHTEKIDERRILLNTYKNMSIFDSFLAFLTLVWVIPRLEEDIVKLEEELTKAKNELTILSESVAEFSDFDINENPSRLFEKLYINADNLKEDLIQIEYGIARKDNEIFLKIDTYLNNSNLAEFYIPYSEINSHLVHISSSDDMDANGKLVSLPISFTLLYKTLQLTVGNKEYIIAFNDENIQHGLSYQMLWGFSYTNEHSDLTKPIYVTDIVKRAVQSETFILGNSTGVRTLFFLEPEHLLEPLVQKEELTKAQIYYRAKQTILKKELQELTKIPEEKLTGKQRWRLANLLGLKEHWKVTFIRKGGKSPVSPYCLNNYTLGYDGLCYNRPEVLDSNYKCENGYCKTICKTPSPDKEGFCIDEYKPQITKVELSCSTRGEYSEFDDYRGKCYQSCEKEYGYGYYGSGDNCYRYGDNYNKFRRGSISPDQVCPSGTVRRWEPYVTENLYNPDGGYYCAQSLSPSSLSCKAGYQLIVPNKFAKYNLSCKKVFPEKNYKLYPGVKPERCLNGRQLADGECYIYPKDTTPEDYKCYATVCWKKCDKYYIDGGAKCSTSKLEAGLGTMGRTFRNIHYDDSMHGAEKFFSGFTAALDFIDVTTFINELIAIDIPRQTLINNGMSENSADAFLSDYKKAQMYMPMAMMGVSIIGTTIVTMGSGSALAAMKATMKAMKIPKIMKFAAKIGSYTNKTLKLQKRLKIFKKIYKPVKEAAKKVKSAAKKTTSPINKVATKVTSPIKKLATKVQLATKPAGKNIQIVRKFTKKTLDKINIAKKLRKNKIIAKVQKSDKYKTFKKGSDKLQTAQNLAMSAIVIGGIISSITSIKDVIKYMKTLMSTDTDISEFGVKASQIMQSLMLEVMEKYDLEPSLEELQTSHLLNEKTKKTEIASNDTEFILDKHNSESIRKLNNLINSYGKEKFEAVISNHRGMKQTNSQIQLTDNMGNINLLASYEALKKVIHTNPKKFANAHKITTKKENFPKIIQIFIKHKNAPNNLNLTSILKENTKFKQFRKKMNLLSSSVETLCRNTTTRNQAEIFFSINNLQSENCLSLLTPKVNSALEKFATLIFKKTIPPENLRTAIRELEKNDYAYQVLKIPSMEMGNIHYSAMISDKDSARIFINDSLLKGLGLTKQKNKFYNFSQLDQLTTLFVEEYGHLLDWHINKKYEQTMVETTGDEGKRFRLSLLSDEKKLTYDLRKNAGYVEDATVYIAHDNSIQPITIDTFGYVTLKFNEILQSHILGNNTFRIAVNFLKLGGVSVEQYAERMISEKEMKEKDNQKQQYKRQTDRELKPSKSRTISSRNVQGEAYTLQLYYSTPMLKKTKYSLKLADKPDSPIPFYEIASELSLHVEIHQNFRLAQSEKIGGSVGIANLKHYGTRIKMGYDINSQLRHNPNFFSGDKLSYYELDAVYVDIGILGSKLITKMFGAGQKSSMASKALTYFVKSGKLIPDVFLLTKWFLDNSDKFKKARARLAANVAGDLGLTIIKGITMNHLSKKTRNKNKRIKYKNYMRTTHGSVGAAHLLLNAGMHALNTFSEEHQPDSILIRHNLIFSLDLFETCANCLNNDRKIMKSEEKEYFRRLIKDPYFKKNENARAALKARSAREEMKLNNHLNKLRQKGERDAKKAIRDYFRYGDHAGVNDPKHIKNEQEIYDLKNRLKVNKEITKYQTKQLEREYKKREDWHKKESAHYAKEKYQARNTKGMLARSYRDQSLAPGFRFDWLFSSWLAVVTKPASFIKNGEKNKSTSKVVYKIYDFNNDSKPVAEIIRTDLLWGKKIFSLKDNPVPIQEHDERKCINSSLNKIPKELKELNKITYLNGWERDYKKLLEGNPWFGCKNVLPMYGLDEPDLDRSNPNGHATLTLIEKYLPKNNFIKNSKNTINHIESNQYEPKNTLIAVGLQKRIKYIVNVKTQKEVYNAIDDLFPYYEVDKNNPINNFLYLNQLNRNYE